jgi:hypothetical protein
MDWFWIIAFLLVMIGILGTLLPMLPGVPLVFMGLLLGAWIDGFAKVSVLTISIIGAITLLALLVDFVASFITVKRAGASKYALWGAAIGALAGLGILGLIVGTILGAAIGELMALKDSSQAAAVGLAAGLGFVIALVVKVVLTMTILAIFAYAYFF